MLIIFMYFRDRLQYYANLSELTSIPPEKLISLSSLSVEVWPEFRVTIFIFDCQYLTSPPYFSNPALWKY